MPGAARPYSSKEQKKIVEYIVQNKAYSSVKGNILWKNMEEVFEHRTWQSLKEHYKKKIYPNLHLPMFGLSPEELQLFKGGFTKSAKERVSNDASDYSEQVGRPYTAEEQERIVEYLLKNRVCFFVKGNKIWKDMERVFGDRTWQSLKEHYKKRVYPFLHLERYGLSAENLQRFRDRGFEQK